MGTVGFWFKLYTRIWVMHSLTCMMHPIQLIFVLSFIIKFQIQLCGSIHTSFQRKIILYNKSYHNQYIHSGHILYVVGIADCATINQFARRPLRSLVKEGILAVYEIGKYLSDKHLLHFLLIFQRYKIKFRRITNSICTDVNLWRMSGSALTTNFHILVSRGRGWLVISQTIKFWKECIISSLCLIPPP